LQGGGMYIGGSSTVTVTTCIISGNTATWASRFPKIIEPLRNSPSPQWSVMKLLNASSPLQGGGMYIEGSSTVTVTTSTISGNTADSVSRCPRLLNRYVTVHRPMDFLFMCSKSELCRFQGGGICMRGGTLYAQDCAITGNTATASSVSVPQNLKPPKSARFFMLSVIQTFSHRLPWPPWSVPADI
jgi:hypothetical protein